MLASLSGVVFFIKGFGSWLHNNAKFIITFSAGIFAVVTYDMLIESFEFSQNNWYAIAGVLFGFFIFAFAERIFPEMHHHDEDDAHCIHSRKKVIWGNVSHNIGDGLLLALAFTVDVQVGFVAALGIFIHEFIKGISEFSLLRLSGYSIKKSLTINFLVSGAIALGIILGTTVSHIEAIAGILFAFASGAFLHLVFTDLIPQSIAHSKEDKKYFIYFFVLIAGIFTILAINQIGGGH